MRRDRKIVRVRGVGDRERWGEGASGGGEGGEGAAGARRRAGARRETKTRACRCTYRGRADANGDGWLTVAWVLERGHVAVLALPEVRFKSNLVALRDDGADVSGTRAAMDGGRRACSVRSEDGWSQYSVDGGAADQNVVRGVVRLERRGRSRSGWRRARRIGDATDDAFTDEVLLAGARRSTTRVCRLDCSTRSVLARTETSCRAGWDDEVERRENGRKRHHSGETRLTTASDATRRKCGIAKKEARVGPNRDLTIHRRSYGDYPVGAMSFGFVRRAANSRYQSRMLACE